ncbi:hypothetical protein [Streptomyces sp. BA2]|uniref:hypothetical protein n=1 Tax=Streptomyces sp. BA2 TaxID=436595 RepID=UPI0013283CA7|nr:hypothetical protein [Streptomyces sp. BA2]MWA08301.1 hypothetical protein [Streptomyces sp. BA2]
MDSTSTTTGCLLDQEGHDPAYVELADAYGANPPIYSALVAEWWARGRMVPGWRDAQWSALTMPPKAGRGDVGAGVGAGRGERVGASQAGADPVS